MYLSEFVLRKAIAESVKAPTYWPKEKNILQIVKFLIEEEKMPYPEEWFLSNAPRTLGIYKQKYAAYWKRFVEKTKKYEVAQQELNRLNYLLEINAVLPDVNTIDERIPF